MTFTKWSEAGSPVTGANSRKIPTLSSPNWGAFPARRCGFQLTFFAPDTRFSTNVHEGHAEGELTMHDREAEMKTVLYIDDSPDDLFLFSKACQAAEVSFTLKLADGSDVARDYLSGIGEYADRRANPLPDFILLDIKMPEMDGFAVLNWIRTHPKVSHTMVALYSSSTVDKDVFRGFLTGTT